jgi:putative transposase
MRFVCRHEQGEAMAELCREFGISRKTGYKIWARYQQMGPEGLFDRSKAPIRVPRRTPVEIREVLLKARNAHPSWGPHKLRAWLLARQPGLVLPAPSTIGDLLKREGLVQVRKRRRSAAIYASALRQALEPNDVWCADFKGQFRLGNGRYCYPLTITDQFSRMLLGCEGLESTAEYPARGVFELAFREHGLPKVLRTDNGTPFASQGLAGLSRLSVWFLKLGIIPERIEPAHPEQNGQHERMHLTLKRETTRPAGANLLQQQERFDRFVDEFNRERPHEALGQVPPASRYLTSDRKMPERVADFEYPLDDEVRTVTRSGHVDLKSHAERFFLGSALGGERVSLRELEEARWMVSFGPLALGMYDQRERKFEPVEAVTFEAVA